MAESFNIGPITDLGPNLGHGGYWGDTGNPFGGPSPSAPPLSPDIDDLNNPNLPMGPAGFSSDSPQIKGTVEKSGYISIQLRQGIQVDITANHGIRVINTKKSISLCLSSCGTQMALVHPHGRVLQYNARIEVQTQNEASTKNAKMWPKGVSFTADNCALVYLLDSAGARTTTDHFHELQSSSITDGLFVKSWHSSYSNMGDVVSICLDALSNAQYWTDEEQNEHLNINGIFIKQTKDGFVCVDRYNGNVHFDLRTSPNNGKVRFQSSFLYVTASIGKDAHIFVKSNERRIHYNGYSFVVRNGGHSAGFDEHGQLKIW